MKTSLVTTLSFLILALATKPQLGASESEPILDVYGNQVDSSHRYYLVSALWGVKTGGGISADKGKNGQCPTDVIQLRPKDKRGKNLVLLPYDNSTIVRESTNIKLKFSRVSSLQQCNKDSLWKVDNDNASLGKQFITIGEGKTCQNLFKLEKVSASIFDMKIALDIPCLYKIVHCSTPVNGSCDTLCKDVGVSNVDGVQRLVVVDDNDQPNLPLPVVLFPADSGRSMLFPSL
uniref:Miraculin-like protein n=1 Tax=Citrus tamurana TaxID=488172 RepID=A0A0B6VQ71_9ROSI|nr:miraculin-like protein [Citrus tamurana]